MHVQSPGREESLEEEMAAHSSIHAWRSPWTQEPGGLQSKESDTTEVTEHACMHIYRPLLCVSFISQVPLPSWHQQNNSSGGGP